MRKEGPEDGESTSEVRALPEETTRCRVRIHRTLVQKIRVCRDYVLRW